MIFTFTSLTEQHGREICAWRYPAPYDIYNWSFWDELSARGEEFADPQIRREQYLAAIGPEGDLIGFAQLFPLVGWTRLGLGLRPDWCGRGAGVPFVSAIVKEAKRRAPSNQIDLEVLTWNTRAIRAYEKAGFVIQDTYVRGTPTGPDEFHCMVYTGD